MLEKRYVSLQRYDLTIACKAWKIRLISQLFGVEISPKSKMVSKQMSLVSWIMLKESGIRCSMTENEPHSSLVRTSYDLDNEFF